MSRQPLRTAIVGYGNAGGSLHHPAWRTTLADGNAVAGPVAVVDPRPPAEQGPDTTDTTWYPDLAALAAGGADFARTVFHVTTPTPTHREVVEELVSRGARMLIVEKPLATTHRDALAMVAVARAAGCRLLPVSVWPSSNVTRRLCAELERYGELRRLHFVQDKPRFDRAHSAAGYRTAFDVELPHQIILAMHLAGPVTEIADAALTSLWYAGAARPGMGSARLRLRHASGVESTLVSDLGAPRRRRALTARTTGGWTVAHFPSDSRHQWGRLTGSPGPLPIIIADRPLNQFLAAAYAYFSGETAEPPPGTGLAPHLAVCALIDEAIDMAGGGRAGVPQRDGLSASSLDALRDAG